MKRVIIIFLFYNSDNFSIKKANFTTITSVMEISIKLLLLSIIITFLDL